MKKLFIISLLIGLLLATPVSAQVFQYYQGGSGIDVAPSAGYLLIGTSGSNYYPGALTAGSNITITNASGSITINATVGTGSWTYNAGPTSFIYSGTTTDDVVFGANSTATAPFWFDVSAGIFYMYKVNGSKIVLDYVSGASSQGIYWVEGGSDRGFVAWNEVEGVLIGGDGNEGMTVYGKANPESNAVFDLGASSYKWRNLYLSEGINAATGTFSGLITVNGGILSSSSSTIDRLAIDLSTTTYATATELYAGTFRGDASNVTVGLNAESLNELFVDILNKGILDVITISDDGGTTVSWDAGEIYDKANSLVVDTDAEASTILADNDIIYIKWVSGSGLTTSTSQASGDEIEIASVNIQGGDIYDIHQDSLYSVRETDIQMGLASTFPVLVTSGIIYSEDTDVTRAFDLQLSAGTYYHDLHEEHIVSATSSVTSTISIWCGETLYAQRPDIIANSWCSGGSMTSTTAAKYYPWLMFTIDGKMHAIAPTVQYDNLNAAIVGGATQSLPTGLTNHPKSTCVILKGNDTALPTAGGDRWIDIRPTITAAPGGTISDHGNLSGLADDDHSAYLLNTYDTGTGLILTYSSTTSGTSTNWVITGSLAFPNDSILDAYLDYGNLADLEAGGAVTWSNLASGELTSEVLILGVDVKAGTLADTKYCIWDNGNNQIVCNSTPAAGLWTDFGDHVALTASNTDGIHIKASSTAKYLSMDYATVTTAISLPNNSIDSADYAAGSIDHEHLADDVISGAAGVGTFESGDTFLCLENGVGLRECDYDDLPGGAAVDDVNGIVGSVVLAGTANQVTISSSSQTITFALPQSIAQASTPTFAGLALGAGNLTLTGSISTSGSRSTKGWFTDLDVHVNVDAGSLIVSGNATTSGVFYGATITDGTFIVNSGTISAGTWQGTAIADAYIPDNITIDLATLATTLTVTDNESVNESNAILFTANAEQTGGNLAIESDGTLTYNPSTGKVTATGFIGALTGNADTVTGFTPAGGSLTLAGADALTLTTTGATNSTLPLGTKTLVATDVSTLSSLTSVGTIGTGTWEGTAIAAGYYAAGSIDGDDINTNYAGRSLTQTAASPDTLDADAETYVCKHKTAFEDPVATDDFFFGEINTTTTFTSIYCKTLVGTVDLDVSIGGSDINGTDITCDTSGVWDYSLGGDTTGNEGEELALVVASVASSPTYLMVQLNCTYDD